MSGNPQALPQPRRGEIWYVVFPSDPPGKNRRPVVIVSPDSRNTHPRATTVLVFPLSTSLTDFELHVRLQPGETGLPEISELQPENISVVRKDALQRSQGTRTLSNSLIKNLASRVVLSMGVQPKDIPDV